MSGVYDKNLRKMAFDICKSMGVSQCVQEGVYCMVGGPNFESIAEARLLHRLGVDAVGKLMTRFLYLMAFDICKSMGVSQCVQEGVYCMVGGPNFESIAEARLLHRLGVDAVGMSTAPEVLVASHCGMRVFGLSLITNKVVKSYEDNASVSHEAVLEVSKMRSETLQVLVTELISRMDINNNTA
ncbi:purine nucleoside phosphorylase-like [Sinocyclocheilus grahami]|uniref:purine nucleoside phosphorylase-like n=1 Tax=Sinocyclocheilus grahami TaxID=75366 RepID=UPI0007AC99FE|nr:PREDICTED: purine nucleoside phosphorylase-like [Sinocyclocheilus grahami]